MVLPKNKGGLGVKWKKNYGLYPMEGNYVLKWNCNAIIWNTGGEGREI